MKGRGSAQRLLGGVAFAVAALLGAGDARAQGYSYEVSTVRLNTTGSGNTSVNTNNDSYTAVNESLKSMIQSTFHLQLESQIIGLPGWAASAHYDVKAKLDAETVARLKALKSQEQEDAYDELMRHLLEERFALKWHRETRELPEYALVEAKGGSKLQPADPTSKRAGNMSVSNSHMEAYAADMQRLAYFLSFQVHRPVVDKTGLAGKYDLKLDWTRDELAANSAADGNAERAPGLMTALQEQLGLKLDSTRGNVEVIVIDHIEQPTEN